VGFALIQVYQKIKKKRTPPKSKDIYSLFYIENKKPKLAPFDNLLTYKREG